MIPLMENIELDNAVHTTMDHLPPILPKFFVPRLTDRPQNPIMDTLRLASETLQSQLSPELTIISAISDFPRPPRRIHNLWLEAMTCNSSIRVCLIFLNLGLFDTMVTTRAKHCRGIDCDHLMLLFHLQPAFFLNKKVWCSRPRDISVLFRNDSNTMFNLLQCPSATTRLFHRNSACNSKRSLDGPQNDYSRNLIRFSYLGSFVGALCTGRY